MSISTHRGKLSITYITKTTINILSIHLKNVEKQQKKSYTKRKGWTDNDDSLG